MSSKARAMQKHIQKNTGSTSSRGGEKQIFTREDVNAIVAQRDQVLIESLGTHLLLPLFELILELELFLRDVDHSVAIWRGDELKQHITLDTINDLGGLLARVLTISDRTNTSPDAALRRVKRYAEAMRKLVNEDDDSDLRELVQNKGGGATIIAEWRDTLKLAGSEKGKNEWSIALARKIAQYVDGDGDDGIKHEVTEAARLAVEHFLSLPVSTECRKEPEQQARIQIKKWDPNKRIDRARGHYYDWLKGIEPRA